MAVKVSRFLTHIKRLREPRSRSTRFLERARHLGRKLGPALLQLPPQLKADRGRLEEALAAVSARRPRGGRVPALVVVHAIRSGGVLEAHGAALCLADRRGPADPAVAHDRLDVPAVP